MRYVSGMNSGNFYADRKYRTRVFYTINNFFRNCRNYYRDGESPWHDVSIVETMKMACYLFADSVESGYVQNTSCLNITTAGTFVA